MKVNNEVCPVCHRGDAEWIENFPRDDDNMIDVFECAFDHVRWQEKRKARKGEVDEWFENRGKKKGSQ